MKVEFEIEESMSEIIAEILCSDKWHSVVKNECNGLKRVTIKDFMDNNVAYAEIWEYEIHLRPASSGSTYRIFCNKKQTLCEYIGAEHGLLKYALFPKLTPVKNIYHLFGNMNGDISVKTPQPIRVYDKFIHDDMQILPNNEII
ncbi:MAG: hypothetical protein LBK65_07480 [Tannerellaceae bacterium]|jgi:hypothetical protein|nr:hypothetical protein [Tannerellaceae bacterium]